MEETARNQSLMLGTNNSADPLGGEVELTNGNGSEAT